MKAKLKKIIKYSPSVALGLTMIACMYAGAIVHACSPPKHQPLR
jgi:hypothetical protein